MAAARLKLVVHVKKAASHISKRITNLQLKEGVCGWSGTSGRTEKGAKNHVLENACAH